MQQSCGTRLLGGEVEGWVATGSPPKARDVPSLLAEMNGSVPAYLGTITVEPGMGSIEFAGGPGRNPRGAAARIRALHRRVLIHEASRGRGTVITTDMKSPFPEQGVGPVVAKQRYRKLWDALRREAGGCGISTEQFDERLGKMNVRAATHLTFSWTGLKITLNDVDDRAVVVKSIADFVAPRWARVLCEHYGVDNTAHLGMWSFARPGRFSCEYGQWSGSFEALKARFESLPRLIKNTSAGSKDDSGWEIDLAEPLRWDRTQDHGSGWWPVCRPKLFDDKNGMLELRFLPSWPLEKLETVFTDLDRFVSHLLDVAPDCIGIETLDGFLRSAAWRKVLKHPIVGDRYLPERYTREQREADIFS